MINKTDLADAGFSIILPTDTAFDEELQRLGFGQNEDAQFLRPLSVILKNSSHRSIVAFALRWTISGPDGRVTTHDQSYLQPSGLLDGTRARRGHAEVEHQIRQDGSRFVTVGGMARTKEELHALARGRSSDATQFSVVSVGIDVAIFDNGECVGTDELGMVSRFEARVDAEQDLMSEIHSRLTSGESLKDILTAIDTETDKDTGRVPITPADVYRATKRSLLNELITTRDNYGDDMALRTVQFRRYDNRPVIRKR
ncbi:MAG: hypothetical protein ACM3SW_05845 [Actinomycetota bacterium]